MSDQRPNPDSLLDKIQRDEKQALRGKLKLFFGASAGVGKTYAMLSAARQLRSQGVDVVAGVVETHGRIETIAQLKDLPLLPLKTVAYQGKKLTEFDLDAALERQPALILIDELAHTNAPGSRHPKRWQDIEELLAAGIDVYSTVNVQHLETLNDIVGNITGIRVQETVPDTLFDQADEVVLVDITPDELLLRLKQGKVYLSHQAATAIRNFFRKGNLIALRELALRRTADRVDEQMRSYRQEQAIDTLWQTKESLLVCIGADHGGDKIIRSASRIATQLGVEWHAVYVETPCLQRLPEAERDRILRTLRLAHDLGGRSATLAGHDAAQTVVDYARSHHFTKIIVGRTNTAGWMIWRRAFADRIGRLSPDIDVIQIGREPTDTRPAIAPRGTVWPTEKSVQSYAWTAAISIATTLLATPIRWYFDLANIVMLFLLAVVVVAVRFGRGPAVLAAFLNVALFDFYFVPPRFSFAVSDVQYLLTFAVMLAVALVIGQLTANLRFQGRVVTNREMRLRALYEMARDLSGVLVPKQIIDLSHQYIEGTFGVKVAILLADEHDGLLLPTALDADFALDAGVAQWSFDHTEPAGFSTDTLPGSPLLYLPLRAPMRTRGVLAVAPANPGWLLIPEQRRQLDGFAALIATALERVHYIQVAQQATLKIESERLRNSVLSALSHDLRTPLTALVGMADNLSLTQPALSDAQREMAAAMREQAFHLSALVDNLLDMARLQSGEVKLNRQWQPLEEVIGSALKSLQHALSAHPVDVVLPPDLPLLEFDAVLIERVFCNLLENAAKYTPPGSRIKIEAALASDNIVQIAVSDTGPGLPQGQEDSIFEKFTRGGRELVTPGVGLGLAICRAIVQAHKGRIWAENQAAGGARFIFTLPTGTPPAIVFEDDAEASEAQTK